VVFAQDPAAPVVGVLAECQRLLALPEPIKNGSQVVGGGQVVGVVLAESPAAAVVGVLLECQRLVAAPRFAVSVRLQLVVTLVPAEQGQEAGPATPQMPAPLVRLGRTARFRQAVKVMAATLDRDAGEFTPQVVAALASLAHVMGKDLAEADWWRLLDALLLIAAHPAASQDVPGS
jgi:hypothetical protein